MISAQAKARKQQAYVEQGPNCGNCARCATFQREYWTKVRRTCTLGNFAVKTVGHCKEHLPQGDRV